MNKKGGLGRRLFRAYALQAIFISIAAALSIVLAGLSIKEVMIKQALRDEAGYFWLQLEKDPQFPLPHTRNLTGYVVGEGHDEPPPELANLEPGFHEMPQAPDFSLAYVTDNDGHRLVLVFDGERVGVLVVWFGIVPLAIVLAIVYLISLYAYLSSRSAISPIVGLARRVDKLDPNSVVEAASFEVPPDSDQDTQMLARALGSYAERLQAFVARERNFTRDASHELRSPLTVIRIAADMLLIEQELSQPAKNSVHRIKGAVKDMEELTEAFLMLARESEAGFCNESVSVNQIVREELDTVRALIADKPISLSSTAECELVVEAPDRILAAMIGNILRNAGNYTDQGELKVHISAAGVAVRDTGVGIEKNDLDQIFTPFNRGARNRSGGHGVGLTIVKRISDRFDWPITIESEVDVGTEVLIAFPDAKVIPLQAQEP